MLALSGCSQPDNSSTGAVTAGDAKVFSLTGSNFKYMMDNNAAPELRVKLGDRVRIDFSSAEGFHDVVIDQFKASTKRIKAGESTSVEFVADKKGEFEYYCSVGNHRANGMKGKLVVE